MLTNEAGYRIQKLEDGREKTALGTAGDDRDRTGAVGYAALEVNPAASGSEPSSPPVSKCCRRAVKWMSGAKSK